MRLSCLLLVLASPLAAQVLPQAAAPAATAPPPATKLEAFKPTTGSVVTVGYNSAGRIGRTSVDVRDIHDATGRSVRGVVVRITESEYRSEAALIDADEIPELIKGIDALLAVDSNPTSFANFEVRYTTKGELQLTAFNRGAQISYNVQTGRVVHANDFWGATDTQKLRAMIVLAQTKLASP